MAERPRTILICSCEDTMPLDAGAVRRACRDAVVVEGRLICRSELDRFRKAAATGTPIVMACTQEAPLFGEVADGIDNAAGVTFVNIRETAGWSKDAKAAGPKMAALIAAAAQTGSAGIEKVALCADPGISKFLGESLSKSERRQLDRLLDKLGAHVPNWAKASEL